MLDNLIGSDATRNQHYVLIASAVLGFAYLFDGFGLALPYPADVVLKASGIILLGVLVGLHRHDDEIDNDNDIDRAENKEAIKEISYILPTKHFCSRKLVVTYYMLSNH